MVERARKGLHGWGYVITIGLLAAAIVIEAFFLIPVVRQQSADAEAGKAARVQQCTVRPVSIAIYDWAHASGRISGAERGMAVAALPSKAECDAVLEQNP